jgi:hypothetical protein
MTPAEGLSIDERSCADVAQAALAKRQKQVDAEAARIDQVERIVEAINPLVAAYQVASLFNDHKQGFQLGLALAGALTALKATFDETSFLNLCRGLGIDPIDATELVDQLAKLTAPSES